MILLPIGSVVRVGGQTAVIVGYRPMLYEGKGTLGYLAVGYPYGYLSADKMLMFPAKAAGEGAVPGYMGETDGSDTEPLSDRLLPVGSVVEIEKQGKPLYMIAGYYPVNETAAGEYAVIPYPNGIVRHEEIGMAGKDQISRVVWRGYTDEEGESILEEIPGFMQATGELMRNFSETVWSAVRSVETVKGKEDEISVEME